MATDNNLLAPSALLLEDQNEVAQPQNVPESQDRLQKLKQILDSSVSEQPFHPSNKMSFGHSDPQGLLGSLGIQLEKNPKLLDDLHKKISMSLLPNHQTLKIKEPSTVIVKHGSSVPTLIPEYSLRNEKLKQIQESLAPTFSLMKLAYQQGMLNSCRARFQEKPKPLEDSNKETSMYRPETSVLQSPPLISEESLRKGKQKLIEESFPPTSPRRNVASQSPGASLMNRPGPSRASQLNLLWLLRQQIQLSKTNEKRPALLPDVRSIFTPKMCALRLKQYVYRQQQRPRDNNIEFWRTLVAEFFAPNAKKRLCLSSNKRRQQISGIFPQEAWCCEICKLRPTAGFEMSAEVLPRLCKIKYETGMLDELLYMDIPEERYTPSGHIVLNYTKVTEQSVYEAARVVREGQLKIVFSSNLKICIWEFCCSFHEIYIDRQSVTPQFHQLKEAIQKYQVFAESSSGISAEEFQRNTNEFASSISELARSLDKTLVNGYPKRYVRSLQISEIVSSMKDLMDYSTKYGVGPAEAMARIHRELAASRVANSSVSVTGPQQHIDDTISQSSSVISFAHCPSSGEGRANLTCGSRRTASSPTSSTASSKRSAVHLEDPTEPNRKKRMTYSGENSALAAPIEPMVNQPIFTTAPSSSIRRSIVQPSIIIPSSTLLVEPDMNRSSKVKAEEDLVTSQNLIAVEADASVDTKLVLNQNENNGNYCYGFDTVDRSYYMDQLENLNGASLFPGIHMGSALTGTLMVNDGRRKSHQLAEQLPYLNGEIDPLDDIQFD